MVYVFKRIVRNDDYIAVTASDYEGAVKELWNTIIGMSGLFLKDYALFSIHKMSVDNFKFGISVKWNKADRKEYDRDRFCQ